MIEYHDNAFKITDHAYKRAKERCNWKKKTLHRMAIKAYNEGLERNDITSSALIRYVDYIRANNRKGFIIFYGQHVYIFAGPALLTIFPVDKKYQKLVNETKKGKVIDVGV